MSAQKKRVRGASYELVSAARELRIARTSAEQTLWQALRGRRLDGCKFRRQHPLGSYVLDFVCTEQKLVVEIDGLHHQLEDQYVYDRDRTELLEQYGYRVIPFSNDAVLRELDLVFKQIRTALCREPGAE